MIIEDVQECLDGLCEAILDKHRFQFSTEKRMYELVSVNDSGMVHDVRGNTGENLILPTWRRISQR